MGPAGRAGRIRVKIIVRRSSARCVRKRDSPSRSAVLLTSICSRCLPQRFVRIVAYACTLQAEGTIALSHEHHEASWVGLDEVGERIAGRLLPAGYLGAIRQAACQPLSP